MLLKRLPGDLDQVAIDEEETFLRQNFSESDNRNYRDGDVESSRSFANGKPEEGSENSKPESSLMYDAPTNAKVALDVDGNTVRTIDKSTKRTTLITDEVRVYKGGSWKDRAYYLSPGARRFLDQNQAADYIGFRCAMSRVGNPIPAKKSK